MEIITTKSHKGYLDKHGIIHIEVMDNAHIDLVALNELQDAIKKISPAPIDVVLVDARAHHTITDDAMSYLKNEMVDKYRLATAIVTNKLGIKIMVDYFTKVLKTNSAIKIFTIKEEALEWLLAIMKK